MGVLPQERGDLRHGKHFQGTRSWSSRPHSSSHPLHHHSARLPAIDR